MTGSHWTQEPFPFATEAEEYEANILFLEPHLVEQKAILKTRKVPMFKSVVQDTIDAILGYLTDYKAALKALKARKDVAA